MQSGVCRILNKEDGSVELTYSCPDPGAQDLVEYLAAHGVRSDAIKNS